MNLPLRSFLPALAIAILAPLVWTPSNADTPGVGFMACIVNRTGNNPRFFYSEVFPRELEDRRASAAYLEKLVAGTSSGRYKLEANCIWHASKAVVMNKMADIVDDVERAGVDTFKWEAFKGME